MGRRGGGTKSRNLDITEQQQKFCENYLNNGRIGTHAAVDAGYSEKSAANNACLLLKMPAINNYLTIRIKKSEEDHQLTFDHKIKTLKTIIDLAVPKDAEFIAQTHPGAAISAIAESNKMQGHYSAEKVFSATLSVSADADLSQAQELVQKLITDKTTGY